MRAPALAGTRLLARYWIEALLGRGSRTLVNVGACDGQKFDDVTPWFRRIRNGRALLVEPIPYNLERLRANFPDRSRFMIEPVAIADKAGRITIRSFDEAALEAGTLPAELQGCSSITSTNLMHGRTAWGEADNNFHSFAAFLRDMEIDAERLQTVLDRNAIDRIDVLLIDAEGADWMVFSQFDFARYHPDMIKIEIGALEAADIGATVLRLKQNGYRIGITEEDIWAFAS
ncbi:FkbM family methyltransferase [Mangrovicella endophytica]|uniref:FkbM family methyltransferase n=1 Tax=Mangrovicella endophytica TaxID=2066697 RepID=UPI001FE16AD6|nr:FkbM family methyltransferase [Mangrovicella endophytica]